MILVDPEGAGIKYLPPYGSGWIWEGTAGRVNENWFLTAGREPFESLNDSHTYESNCNDLFVLPSVYFVFYTIALFDLILWLIIRKRLFYWIILEEGVEEEDDESEYDEEAEADKRHEAEEKKKAEKAHQEFIDSICVFIAFIIIIGASIGT